MQNNIRYPNAQKVAKNQLLPVQRVLKHNFQSYTSILKKPNINFMCWL